VALVPVAQRAIRTRVRLCCPIPLIPCWRAERLIPKRCADPRAGIAGQTGANRLIVLDLNRPNREEPRFRAD
jgi:hypothetical protein